MADPGTLYKQLGTGSGVQQGSSGWSVQTIWGNTGAWSRLITQWALSTYKKEKEKTAPYIETAEKLFDWAVEDGWNADGAPGIVYTTDWDGKPVVHDRMHWVLAEAINTSAVLWHVTGKQKYAEAYAEFMEYLDEKV